MQLYVSKRNEVLLTKPSDGPWIFGAFQKVRLEIECSKAAAMKMAGRYQGSLNYPFGGNETLQTYGKFEGFPLLIVHGLGW